MIAKRHLITAILGTFCLTTLLFMVVPTRSQTEPEYDHWKDVNDDGKIDILDITMLTSVYGAQGTPINKTELLLLLLAKIEQLNATVIQQQNMINNLTSTVTYLNETVVFLNNTKGLGSPNYDSGWTSIATNQNLNLTHGLSTEKVFVYLIGKNINYYGIHQKAYGGETYGISNYNTGVYWHSLTNTNITIYRQPEDTTWDQVRVMLWKIP